MTHEQSVLFHLITDGSRILNQQNIPECKDALMANGTGLFYELTGEA
jgi:hypothetical protein